MICSSGIVSMNAELITYRIKKQLLRLSYGQSPTRNVNVELLNVKSTTVRISKRSLREEETLSVMYI